jgi:ectoine hydroxylase-related dioxygenase (phytanoyl-CoA dioxygenase family)
MGVTVGDAEIKAYREDGVVVLRNCIDAKWIDSLRVGVEKDLVFSGPRAEIYTKPEDPGLFFNDFYMYKRIPEFRDYALNGPGAEIAARLMGAKRVDFFKDHLFVKEPGTVSARVPWHQDQPYCAVDGHQFLTVWTPLDPVPEETTLEFIRGSHLWGRSFAPFDAMKDGAVHGSQSFERAPDFEAERASYDIASWTLEPGDCLAFHAMIVHQGKGNPTKSTRRRAVIGRYLGDDALYAERDPLAEFPHEVPPLKHGEPLRNAPDDFPQVWPR